MSYMFHECFLGITLCFFFILHYKNPSFDSTMQLVVFFSAQDSHYISLHAPVGEGLIFRGRDFVHRRPCCLGRKQRFLVCRRSMERLCWMNINRMLLQSQTATGDRFWKET